jgi:hypothetical protein
MSFEDISEKRDPGAACREMVPKPQQSTFRENSLSTGGIGCIITWYLCDDCEWESAEEEEERRRRRKKKKKEEEERRKVQRNAT